MDLFCGFVFLLVIAVVLCVAVVKFIQEAWPYLVGLLALALVGGFVVALSKHENRPAALPASAPAPASGPQPQIVAEVPAQERDAESVLEALRARQTEQAAMLTVWRAERTQEPPRLRARLRALPAALQGWEQLLRAGGRYAGTRRMVERVAMLERGIRALEAATARQQEGIADLEQALWMARHRGALTRTLDEPEAASAVALQVERARAALDASASPVEREDLGYDAEAVFRRWRGAHGAMSGEAAGVLDAPAAADEGAP